MVEEHLKCCFGHALCPCKPHGLQSSFSVVSMMLELLDNGPKPNAGTVLQYMTVVGAFVAEQRCMGAESFT